MTKNIKLSDFQIELQKTTLPSGVKLTHFKKLNAPIAITVGSRSGSRYDPKGKEGLSHFLEHMMFMGTEKYPSKKDIAMTLEDTGSRFGASTGTEALRIEFIIANRQNLSLIADVLDQIINKPTLSEKAIESEKRVIATEITSKLETHKRILWNNTLKLIYETDPITNNFSGTIEAIETINREDLLLQLKEKFPQDLTVVSCGDCEVGDIADALSNVLPYKPLENFKPAEIKQVESKISVSKDTNSKLVHCKISFPTCDVASKDKVALNIISGALGRGRASLLKEALRYDSGLLYSVSSGSNYFADTGIFQIDFSVKKENFAAAIEGIAQALENFRTNGISDQTLTSIKNRIINSSTISMQTVGDWVDYHLSSELLIKDNNFYYNDFLNKLNEIDKDSVDNIARQYLTKENMYVAVVGDVDATDVEKLFN